MTKDQMQCATLEELKAFKERSYELVASLSHAFDVASKVYEKENIQNETSLNLSKHLNNLKNFFEKTLINSTENIIYEYSFSFPSSKKDDSTFVVDNYTNTVDSKQFLYYLLQYEKIIFHICTSIIELFESPNEFTSVMKSIINNISKITSDFACAKAPD